VQVKIEKPIMRIPMLAIHLNRTIGTDGFNPNKQSELVPILATSARLQLEKPSSAATNGATATDAASGSSEEKDAMHDSALLEALAEAAGCKAAEIVDLELNCCDTQPGQLGGLRDEFVFVGRLDNLAMSWCSMQVRPAARQMPLAICGKVV
jgi:aspartyl aminopeptidase